MTLRCFVWACVYAVLLWALFLVVLVAWLFSEPAVTGAIPL